MLKKITEYEQGKTIVFFIRHGEKLLGQENHRIPGLGLSNNGIEQAKEIAKEFSKYSGQIDKIYCSDMLRAKQTAEYISKSVKRKITQRDNLSEFNKFVWERKVHHPKFWKHYIKYIKSRNALKNILKENVGKTIIIVGHGNVMKGFIGKCMGMPFKKRGLLEKGFCNVSKLSFNKDKIDHVYYYNSPKVF